jgi:hypothetical protein
MAIVSTPRSWPTERWISKELDAEDSELIASLPNLEAGVDVEITLRGSRIWSDAG